MPTTNCTTPAGNLFCGAAEQPPEFVLSDSGGMLTYDRTPILTIYNSIGALVQSMPLIKRKLPPLREMKKDKMFYRIPLLRAPGNCSPPEYQRGKELAGLKESAIWKNEMMLDKTDEVWQRNSWKEYDVGDWERVKISLQKLRGRGLALRTCLLSSTDERFMRGILKELSGYEQLLDFLLLRGAFMREYACNVICDRLPENKKK